MILHYVKDNKVREYDVDYFFQLRDQILYLVTLLEYNKATNIYKQHISVIENFREKKNYKRVILDIEILIKEAENEVKE